MPRGASDDDDGHDTSVAAPPAGGAAADGDLSSDASDDGEGSLASARGRRSFASLRRLLLVSAFLVVFLACITVSIRNWSRYERKRYELEWAKRSCTIRSKEMVADPSNQSKFRVQAKVIEMAQSTIREAITAYYGTSPAYLFTRAVAEQHLAILRIGRTTCWVRLSNGDMVSLREITAEEAGVSRNPLYVAWATTFVAAVFGVLSFTLASHWVSEFVGTRVVGRFEDGVARPAAAAKGRAFLTAAQVRFVCATFAKDVKRDDGGIREWVCSVCLDEGGEEGVVRTVVLPCRHRFHGECIKKWMRRGKGACPLCGWDARVLFGSDGAPVGDGVEGKVSFSEGTGGEEGAEAEIVDAEGLGQRAGVGSGQGA